MTTTIDQRVEQAKAELRAMAQKALDEISIKVGWFIRSDAQTRRWRNAAKINKEKIE